MLSFFLNVFLVCLFYVFLEVFINFVNFAIHTENKMNKLSNSS